MNPGHERFQGRAGMPQFHFFARHINMLSRLDGPQSAPYLHTYKGKESETLAFESKR
jgi:hypothetical protein